MYDDFNVHDTILLPVTYDDLVLMLQNLNPAYGRTLRAEFENLLHERTEEALELFDCHVEDIYEEAFPDTSLRNAPGWTAERVEDLAKDIYEWLVSKGMWVDTCIYYNGKRMCTSSEKNGERVFRYNGVPFIEENVYPRDYLEYVANPHILSMSFEGPLYEVLNAYCHGWKKLEEEFQNIFKKHGCYYEMGQAWNLSVCE